LLAALFAALLAALLPPLLPDTDQVLARRGFFQVRQLSQKHYFDP
jgi:hypothetical protein